MLSALDPSKIAEFIDILANSEPNTQIDLNTESPSSTHLSGLRLEIAPAKDHEGDKRWVKKAHIAYRMHMRATEKTEIGYVDNGDSIEKLRRLELSSLLKFGHEPGRSLLLLVCGEDGASVVNEAISANSDFDPGKFDLDGYAIA